MRLFSFFRNLKPRAQAVVTFTEEGVRCVRSNGLEEKIRWADLQEVSIITNDEGPFAEDVFFLLVGTDGKSGCAVPQSSDGTNQLLERLQKLPNFKNEAVIKAMGSTSNAKFVCWKKSEA